MSFIGDLERLFATSLYPLRVPIAIGLVVAFVGLVLVARRRGWFAAARRHPGRTGALVAVLLVVGTPLAWYLGSPLFIRTVLEEPAPSAVAGAPTAPTADPVAATPAPTATAATPAVVESNPGSATLSGEFVGADDFHFGSGRALLVEAAPGSWVVRFEDFSVRNGPDLFVYLSPSPDGYAEGAIELGTLKATDGSFNTDVPAGTIVSGARSVVIWCKAFAVQFAHAALE